MRNKAIFLATTAMAVVAAPHQAMSSETYVSIFGGGNWQSDNSGRASFITCCTQDGTITFNENTDTGFVLGGSVGTGLDRWAKGLKVEIEASYRRNDISGTHHFDVTDGGTFADGTINGNTSTFALMANIWYEFDIGTKFRPYVGGGAGWARSNLDAVAAISDSSLFTTRSEWDSTDQTRSGFAYQLGVGFNYNVAPGVDVGLGYRYFRGPSFDPIFLGKNGDDLAVPFDNDSHAVQVNLSIGIN